MLLRTFAETTLFPSASISVEGTIGQSYAIQATEEQGDGTSGIYGSGLADGDESHAGYITTDLE
jgi:hypothetical protein